MNNVVIDLMDEKDLDEVAKVFVEVFNDAGENWTIDIAQEHVEKNFFGDCHFVARIEGEIVGFVIAMPLIFERGLSMFVDAVGVLPKYQRKGIGTLLWKKMNVHVEAIGEYDAIRLLTHPDFRSFEWYKKMGYEKSGWVEVFKKVK